MTEDISRKSTNVVLDPEISSEIISKAIEESAFMQLADRMTIAGNGKKYQTIEGDPVPEWVGETDPAPVGKFSFGKKVIEPYKMELIVPFSNEFKRDKKGLYDECVKRLPKLFGRLITSQNATAPKHIPSVHKWLVCLITSQNATAPKQLRLWNPCQGGLITSQNATAPKR